MAGTERPPSNNIEHIEIEPKIDYDELSVSTSTSPPPTQSTLSNTFSNIELRNQQHEEQRHHHRRQHQKTQSKFNDPDIIEENSLPTSSTAALTLAPIIPASSSSAICIGSPLQDANDGGLLVERELNEQEMHLERMHEYFIQQQQQHLQQQQQQHPNHQEPYHHHQQQQQQHLEQLMQENSTVNSLRQRKERMSKRQKEIYVNFLERNPIINEHRRNDPALNHYWLKLADILNLVPQGAVKHVTEWKQTFDNWRYRVFLYARYNSKISGDEALNPKCFKPLTVTDKRAYNIWIRNSDTAPPDLEHMRNVFMNLEEAPHD